VRAVGAAARALALGGARRTVGMEAAVAPPVREADACLSALHRRVAHVRARATRARSSSHPSRSSPRSPSRGRSRRPSRSRRCASPCRSRSAGSTAAPRPRRPPGSRAAPSSPSRPLAQVEAGGGDQGGTDRDRAADTVFPRGRGLVRSGELFAVGLGRTGRAGTCDERQRERDGGDEGVSESGRHRSCFRGSGRHGVPLLNERAKPSARWANWRVNAQRYDSDSRCGSRGDSRVDPGSLMHRSGIEQAECGIRDAQRERSSSRRRHQHGASREITSQICGFANGEPTSRPQPSVGGCFFALGRTRREPGQRATRRREPKWAHELRCGCKG
jgi:hypothetical protein